MGYHLTSVYGISPDDTHTYFVFYIGDPFEDKVSQWLDKNFSTIARELGPDAVLVRGLSEQFDNEFLSIYQKQIETVLVELGRDGRWEADFGVSVYKLLNNYHKAYNPQYPYFRFLFITDTNPQLASENVGNIFYLIPLDDVKDEYEMGVIAKTIVACIKSNNFEALDELVKHRFKLSQPNLVEAINDSLELKPNIAGVGINLNAVIEKINRRWHR